MIKSTVKHHYGEVKYFAGEGFFATVTAISKSGEKVTRTGFDPDTPQGAIDKAEWAIFRIIAPENEGTQRLMDAIINK